MEDLRKQFAKDFAYLETGVVYAAWLLQHGSYADRNPHLGKMVTCPVCHRRHRQALLCCEPHYATTINGLPLDESVEYAIHFEATKGKECMTERVGELFSKRALRDMKRQINRRRRPANQGFLHGKQVHDLTLEMQAGVRDVEGIQYYSPNALVIRAAREMHIPVPEIRNIPAFAERYWLWKNKMTKRSQRVARRTRQGA